MLEINSHTSKSKNLINTDASYGDLLSFAQFLGTSGRTGNSFHDGPAKAFLLQSVKSRDRRPARRGHFVPQLSEMLRALERHARRTVYRLGRELECHLSG